jgi:hypothetical protein
MPPIELRHPVLTLNLTWDGATLGIADTRTGRSLSVPSPCSLLVYRYEQSSLHRERGWTYQETINGLAILDAAGLVVAELPGEWDPHVLDVFARGSGIPLYDARILPGNRVRAILAARAPGWARLTGLPIPWHRRWLKPVAIGLGSAATLAMVYLVSVDAWYVWRVFSTFGRLLPELAAFKWTVFLFSPLLLVIAPVQSRLRRRRIRRGIILASPVGLCLSVTGRTLHIHRGSEVIAAIPLGAHALASSEYPPPAPVVEPQPASTSSIGLEVAVRRDWEGAMNQVAGESSARPSPVEPESTFRPVWVTSRDNLTVGDSLSPDVSSAVVVPGSPDDVPSWVFEPVDRVLPPPPAQAFPVAAKLLLYGYEDLAGLILISASGEPLHHIPGLWLPEQANRFAARHGLVLEVRVLQKNEYMMLVARSHQATP